MKRLTYFDMNDQRAQGLACGHLPRAIFTLEDPLVSRGMTMA